MTAKSSPPKKNRVTLKQVLRPKAKPYTSFWDKEVDQEKVMKLPARDRYRLFPHDFNRDGTVIPLQDW